MKSGNYARWPKIAHDEFTDTQIHLNKRKRRSFFLLCIIVKVGDMTEGLVLHELHPIFIFKEIRTFDVTLLLCVDIEIRSNKKGLNSSLPMFTDISTKQQQLGTMGNLV